MSLMSKADSSITVMGESAGGSSIMHHSTANGGKSNPPFHRAILQLSQPASNHVFVAIIHNCYLIRLDINTVIPTGAIAESY